MNKYFYVAGLVRYRVWMTSFKYSERVRFPYPAISEYIFRIGNATSTLLESL